MAELRLEHIYKVYPNGTKAVSDFTMDIKDKEFIVFVGPSGCGKSTTLRMIAGLEDISAGELYIGDRIVNDVEPKDRDIAMVFQNYALYPHMTVYENMAFGLKLRHVPNAEIHEKVLWAAKVLDLTEYLDRKPKAMSGGQRQRVALGRAILRNPKVMLLDEPLSNLDAKLRAQMRSEIAKLHEELKTTFIYVTHDQVEAMTLGTRVVVMRLGRIMQIDTPKNLYDYPNNIFVAGFIGTPQMNFFKATLSKNNDNIFIDFKYSDDSLTVPHALLAKVKPQYFDGKTEVVIGLRCENLSLQPEVVNNSKYLLDVRISHFEELGSETLIYADINKDGDGFTESSTRVIIKGTSNYGLQKGQIVKAAVNVSKMHIFDSVNENTINPRIPNDNLLSCEIKDNKMIIDEYSFDLPEAINLENGKYDVLIPCSAVILGNDLNNQISLDNKELIEGTNVLSFRFNNQLLFTTIEGNNTADKYSISFDFTQFEFSKDTKVVHTAISKYDKINAIFLNYATAKTYVGTKYDKIIQERLSAVDLKYLPQIEALKKQYELDCQNASKVNSSEIVNKNAPEIAKRRESLNAQLKKLKEDLTNNSKEIEAMHKENNKKITENVEATYAKIKHDEIKSFEEFKKINKDKDVYRKRAQEIREFNSNFNLEKKNELEKQINLEAIRYESESNSLKNVYKRTVESLKKEFNDFVNACKNEAYPLKNITKIYNENIKKLEKEYKHEKDLAEIIFFFKSNNLITLSTDIISNKMIQSLGVKVFTKQYILEIPHDAYIVANDGLELEITQKLNFGSKTFLKCILNENENKNEIYVELKPDMPQEGKLKVVFDITKIHITEKAMDIKIY